MEKNPLKQRAEELQELREQGILTEDEYKQEISRLQTYVPPPQAPVAPPAGLDFGAPPSTSGADFFATGGAMPPPPTPQLPPESPTFRKVEAPDRPVLMQRYQLDKLLGEGGMGRVFLASDQLTRQKCALKLVHPHLAEDEHIRARFIQELTLTQSLTHPNIVRTFNLMQDADRGVTFFTMEFVEGQSLEEILEDAEDEGMLPPLPLEQTLEIVESVGSALEYAHSQGIIHRDIKPANVLLATDGTTKLMDFGIARITSENEENFHTGQVGTVYYMAPEQLRGNAPVSQAADQFSLAVMLYQMLTGELPVGNVPKPSELVDSLPSTLDSVVLQALSPQPDRRYDSVLGFVEALKKAMKRASRRGFRSPDTNSRRRRSRSRNTPRKPRPKAMTVHSLEQALGGFVGAMESAINQTANQLMGSSAPKKRTRTNPPSRERTRSSRSRFRSRPGSRSKK